MSIHLPHPHSDLDEVGPDHASWGPARAAFNVLVDQRPACVVRVASTADAAAAVRAAAGRGLRVAVQGTGHGAGALPPLAGTMLLRTDAMTAVEVDAERGLVSFGAAARARDVTAAAAAHGLAVPTGFAATTGLTGLVLGGGVGWLARRHGFASGAVESVELVTADGEVHHVHAGHDPELLWALRGGGGVGLGVVCRTTVRAARRTAVHGGALFYPVERAREVLGAWRDALPDLPDDVTTVGRVLAAPPLPEVPEPLRGRTWCVVEAVHPGRAAELDAVLAPLRALGPELDTVGPLAVTDLPSVHGDPESPVPVTGDHALLEALPDAALDALLAAVGPGSGSPLTSVELRHLGGTLARTPDDDGPLAAVAEPLALHAVAVAPTPAARRAADERLRSLRVGLGPWVSTRVLPTLTERPMRDDEVFPAATLERLRAVKRRVDPEERFVGPITPGGGPHAVAVEEFVEWPLRVAGGAVLRTADTATERSFLGGRTRVRLHGDDTGGLLTLHDHLLPAGSATPWHVHPHDDETFLVLAGTLEVKVGDERFVVGADDAAFLPRGVPHAFRVAGPGDARVVVAGTPAGHESFFLAAGDPVDAPAPPDLDRMTRAAASARFAILGPPPFPVA